MKKLVSILLAAALCAALYVPALAETPMDASAVLFGNGFPIVANTSNEELDEKAAEDIASDDEMELEKKPGDDSEEPEKRPGDDSEELDKKLGDDSEEPDKEPFDDDEEPGEKTFDEPDRDFTKDGSDSSSVRFRVNSVFSEGSIVLAAVIGGVAVLAVAGVVIYKKKKTEN